MALQKTETLTNGTSGDYWKVGMVNITKVDGQYSARVDVHLWTDETTRNAEGAQPLTQKNINTIDFQSIKLSDLTVDPDATIWEVLQNSVYNYIQKQIPIEEAKTETEQDKNILFFKGATNV